MTASAIAPYSRAETATAASWMPFIDQAIAVCPGDATGAIVEAVDKLYRRGLITEAVASLLAEIFDVEDARPKESYANRLLDSDQPSLTSVAGIKNPVVGVHTPPS